MCNGGCDDVTLNVGQTGAQGPQGIAGTNGAAVIYNDTTSSATTQDVSYEVLKEYTLDITDTGEPLANLEDALLVDIMFKQSSFASFGGNGIKITIGGTDYFTHGGLGYLLPSIIRKIELKITKQSNTSLFIELKEFSYGGLSSGYTGGGYQRLDNDHMIYTTNFTVPSISANGLEIQASGLSTGVTGGIICNQLMITSLKKVQ